MKKCVWSICLLLVLFCCAVPVHTVAENDDGAISVMDHYETGMNYFYLESYQQANQYFTMAGNYQDAKKWAYYCEAIDYTISNSQDETTLNQAYYRFDLLAQLDFHQADEWAMYCKARSYENAGMKSNAAELYACICVHDSVDRYLICTEGQNFLKREVHVARSRVEAVASNTTGMSSKELYTLGQNLYYLEDYALAADCFFLAGNYQDAKKWLCYCSAVDLITQYDDIERASLLFDLLAAQDFGVVEQWILYLKGRAYENINPSMALDCYRQIFIYDSSERYLKLCNVN